MHPNAHHCCGSCLDGMHEEADPLESIPHNSVAHLSRKSRLLLESRHGRGSDDRRTVGLNLCQVTRQERLSYRLRDAGCLL